MDRRNHSDESSPRLTGDRGASLVEYALLVALIAVVCIGAITLLGTNLQTSYNSAGQSVANAN